MSERCDYLVDNFPIVFQGEPHLECLRPEGHAGEHIVCNERGDWYAWEPDQCACEEGGCGCIVYGEITEADAVQRCLPELQREPSHD